MYNEKLLHGWFYILFGYVLPEKPEMKIREYELFRAYYCGVCKSIGERYGLFSRLTLNYDSTFLALLLHSLTDEKLLIKSERCIAHPLNKHKVIKANTLIDYASDINIILAYYNLEDNWNDEKSILSRSAMLILKSAFKKLSKKYSEKCGIIEKKLSELRKLENEKSNSMDRAAEPFAKLMEEVMYYTPLFKSEKKVEAIKWIGYNLGKWIYILDAFDDIKKDIKAKSYNPLLLQYNYKGDNIEEFKGAIRQKVEFNLTYSLGQIAKAYELLEVKNNIGILENIIYMGMLRKTEQILGTGSCGKIE
jgi:hypothetical protein